MLGEISGISAAKLKASDPKFQKEIQTLLNCNAEDKINSSELDKCEEKSLGSIKTAMKGMDKEGSTIASHGNQHKKDVDAVVLPLLFKAMALKVAEFISEMKGLIKDLALATSPSASANTPTCDELFAIIANIQTALDQEYETVKEDANHVQQIANSQFANHADEPKSVDSESQQSKLQELYFELTLKAAESPHFGLGMDHSRTPVRSILPQR